MKKIGIIVLSILFFASCGDSERKILVEGTTYVELNVRASPNSDRDGNILDELDPGDVVQIVGFDKQSSEDGIFWCEIKLNNSQSFDGEEVKYGFAAYKVRDLPFIISNKSWKKIQKMYEMEYEKEDNEILTKSKTWLTPAIYDYVYNTSLHDIQYEYDIGNVSYGNDNPNSKYEIESPSHSVDFDEDQHCRVRITTSSTDRDETALYAVIFNQSPRTIHFFRQDKISNRGQFVSSQDFSNSLSSSIKNIERRTKSKKLYIRDYYGDRTRLELNYDAIRIRPRSGSERYIIYNASRYTNSNMDGSYLSIVEEYRR